MSTLSIVIITTILLGLYIAIIYNKLITLKNRAKESWSGIDTQLKLRFDLIPNIVTAVKGYASHEKETLKNITEARTQAINAKTIKEKENADNILTTALKSVFALAESYPDLKANQNFLHLQETLKEIEDNIQHSRRYYNATVRDLNILIEKFPSNLVAKLFKFTKREFFKLDNVSERDVVAVDI